MLFKLGRRLFVIFVFVIITIFCLFLLDQKENDRYYHIEGYDFIKFSLKQNDKYDKKDYLDMIDFANKNHVILMKNTEVNMSGELINTFYFSKTDIKDILDQLDIKYTVNKGNLTTACSITLDQNKCTYHILDLLGNNNVQIKTLSDLFSSEDYMFSDYRIYYKDPLDADNFLKEMTKRFEETVTEYDESLMGMNLGASSTIQYVPISIIFIFVLFYLVLEMFNVYQASKRVSVMKLMGIGLPRIYRKLMFRDILFYILLSVILLILLRFSIIDIDVEILMGFVLLYLFICLVFLILSFLSLVLIYYKKSMIEILKNHSIIRQLLKVCSLYKVIVSFLMIILLITTLGSGVSYFDKVKMMQRMEKVKDWGFYAIVNEENNQYNFENRSNLNKFYEALNNSNIDYIYEDFSQYDITNPEDIVMTDEAIDSGEDFPFATVDYNYLKQSGIKIKNENNQEIELTKKDHEYFIFPEEYKEYHERFINYYKKEVDKKFKGNSIKFNDKLFTYQADEIYQHYVDKDDGDVVVSKLKIKKPILRITYDQYPINYLDDLFGLNLIGTNETTALKIKIKQNKQDTVKELDSILEKEHLDKVFQGSNFVTALDLVGNELLRYKNEIILEGIMFLLALSIYMIITVEINLLQLEKRNKEIYVKLLLGYDKKRALNKIYRSDIVTIMIPIIVALGFELIIVKSFNIMVFLAILLTIAFELIVFICVTMNIRLNKVSENLKGEK